MEHDFIRYPELQDSELQALIFKSPHQQILSSFPANVEKVHDGDTVTLSCTFREFKFPMRLLFIDAPELNARGGEKAREYLKNFCEGKSVWIEIDRENRVEKWGRLLGDIICRGIRASEVMIMSGNATEFEKRRLGELPNLKKEYNIKKWLKT